MKSVEVKSIMDTFQQQFENNPVWQNFRKRFKPIYTYDEFKQAISDGEFHVLSGGIVKIEDYKNFKRACIWGDYSQSSDFNTQDVNFASCCLPDGARDGDFLFLSAKLTHGRKGETDLKYIWHHIIPYETLGE